MDEIKDKSVGGVKLGVRGIRNRNPGNIRFSDRNAWRGKVSAKDRNDDAFEEFKEMRWGMRAQMVLLKTYFNKYGLNTISKVVNRWAPLGDGGNNPDRYGSRVAKLNGWSKDRILNLNNEADLVALAWAMGAVENGNLYRNTVLSKVKYRAAYELV